MTAYFDKRESQCNGAVIGVVATVEAEVIKDLRVIMLHPEFPEELAEEINHTIKAYRVQNDDGSTGNGFKYFQAMQFSRLLSELHSLLHKLGERRIVTTDGIHLTDKPDDMIRDMGGNGEGQ